MQELAGSFGVGVADASIAIEATKASFENIVDLLLNMLNQVCSSWSTAEQPG